MAIYDRNRIVMRLSLLAAFLFFLPYLLPGQKSKPVILTNSDVVQMFKAGLTAKIIVAKIKHTATNFDTTPKALIALKAERLPDSVIMAMVSATPARTDAHEFKPCGPAEAGMTPCAKVTGSPSPRKPTAPPSHARVAPLLGVSVRPLPSTISGSAAGEKKAESVTAEDKDAWQPVFDMDGQLYPSMVLELAGSSSRLGSHAPPNYLGDPMGVAGVKVFCWKDGERVQVGIRIDGLSEESTSDVLSPHLGTYYYVYPVIRYDTAKLQRVSESYPTTVEYSVEADGEDLGQKTLTIQVRSVNDIPIAIALRSGEVKNLSALFAGFVDENNPRVQALLPGCA